MASSPTNFTVPAIADARRREKSLRERLTYQRQLITEWTYSINKGIPNGVNASDQHTNRAEETLVDYEREKAYLQARIAEVVEERKLMEQEAKETAKKQELEVHRRTALSWYTIYQYFKSEKDRDNMRAAARRNAGPATSHTGLYDRARAFQILREHERLSSGREPVDPFGPRMNSWHRHSSELAQIILLERISSNPKLADHYPYAREILEQTKLDSDDQIRVIAKSAVENQFNMPEPELQSVNSLPLEMQDLHERIVAESWFCDDAKIILLLATYIPPGRYSTYADIRDCMMVLPYKYAVDTYTVSKALRNGTRYFSFDEVPAHRVIAENGNRPSEGARMNGDGRIISDRFKFRDTKQTVKGTMVEKFIKSGRDEDVLRAEMRRVVIV